MRAAYCGVFLGLAFGTLHAQTVAKAVHVTVNVKDQSGAVIPKALVNVARAAGEVAVRPALIHDVTNLNGNAEFDLLPNRYGLEVGSPGFIPLHMPLVVNGASDQTVLVVLEVENGGYSGPCCFERPTLLPPDPVELTELISAPALPRFVLPSRSWSKSGRRQPTLSR
jgi:hypothetical protein